MSDSGNEDEVKDIPVRNSSSETSYDEDDDENVKRATPAEERQDETLVQSAVSIHTFRGWAAMSGVARPGAGATSILWAAAACLLLALVVQCCRTIMDRPGVDHGDGPVEDDTVPSAHDLVVIACVQIALAAATFLSAAICARIDCST